MPAARRRRRPTPTRAKRTSGLRAKSGGKSATSAMMARQSAAQSGKRGFQASLRSTFRRGRQITTMRSIRQEGPPPDLGGEEPKKTPPPPGHAEGEPDDG